ncbi:ROK family transcriptional regulator [Nonomuraea sp. NN258]|uniref:ROK family transcriptional regulator n=1 Tax=Nonomuraea antri TaxID=2730852 RepID=UPI001568F3A6|nr:ROK family transcriptional regulator [Nonomuraea antri]NRQ36131.1 ROK family transcriptional regulator [Nonomuraea antri]
MRTATPSTARAINDRLALDLLLDRGPLTAPQVRTLTGLSRPTVSDLIERLQANGLIEVTGESGGDRRGPNARLYGIVADRAHVAGVDVRRDSVHVTVADITGRTVGSVVREPAEDLPALVATAVAAASGPLALHAVVIGAPGMVDPRTGDLAGLNDVPGWRLNTLGALRERMNVPVVLENEVNLAAIAEHRAGAAAGRSDFVLFWLDDGIGAAVVLDGRLRRGMSGGAGEIGYLPVSGERLCDVLEGETMPRLPIDELARRVAEGVFAAVAVLDPGLVVLAGAAGRAGGEELAALVERRLSGMGPVPVAVRATGISDNPVLKGAVMTALSMARDDVFGAPALS